MVSLDSHVSDLWGTRVLVASLLLAYSGIYAETPLKGKLSVTFFNPTANQDLFLFYITATGKLSAKGHKVNPDDSLTMSTYGGHTFAVMEDEALAGNEAGARVQTVTINAAHG
jgi:hypothetical protein